MSLFYPCTWLIVWAYECVLRAFPPEFRRHHLPTSNVTVEMMSDVIVILHPLKLVLSLWKLPGSFVLGVLKFHEDESWHRSFYSLC